MSAPRTAKIKLDDGLELAVDVTNASIHHWVAFEAWQALSAQGQYAGTWEEFQAAASVGVNNGPMQRLNTRRFMYPRTGGPRRG